MNLRSLPRTSLAKAAPTGFSSLLHHLNLSGIAATGPLKSYVAYDPWGAHLPGPGSFAEESYLTPCHTTRGTRSSWE